MLSKLQEKIILTHYLNSGTLLIKYELKHIFRQIRSCGGGRKKEKKRAPKRVLLGEGDGVFQIRRQAKTEATRSSEAAGSPGEGSKEDLRNRRYRCGAEQTSRDETSVDPGREDLV